MPSKLLKILRVLNKLILILFLLGVFGYLPLGYAIAAFFITLIVLFIIVLGFGIYIVLKKYINSVSLRLFCTLGVLVMGPLFWFVGHAIKTYTGWAGVELLSLFIYGSLSSMLLDVLMLKRASSHKESKTHLK